MRDFNYTVNVLVKAYLNDTLEHDSCQACAVGNIIADSLGVHVCRQDNDLRWDYGVPWWYGKTEGRSCVMNCQQQDSTGYSAHELTLIENAFEGVPHGISDEEWMFNGLMAVVDVLAEIHGIELTAREEAKLLFVKA